MAPTEESPVEEAEAKEEAPTEEVPVEEAAAKQEVSTEEEIEEKNTSNDDDPKNE